MMSMYYTAAKRGYAMNWAFLGLGVAQPLLVHFSFGASIVQCLFNILFYIIVFW